MFLSKLPGLTHQIDNLVNNIGIGIGIRIGIGVGIGPIDLSLDEVEGERFEDAIESGLDDFARFESENDRLEDGNGIGGREAEERRLVEIGGVSDGSELVQDGFAKTHLQISTQK